MSSTSAYADPTYWTPVPAEPERPTWTPVVIEGGKSPAVAPSETRDDSPPKRALLQTQFDVLAEELAADGAGVSNTRRLIRHPAYLGILALGEPAIPLLLDRLKHAGGRPIWLTLLGSLTSYQPGAGMETIEDAAAQWVRWGKLHGYLV